MTKNLPGIYMIISPTAKVYIGQSVDVDRRIKGYKRMDCTGQVRLFASLMKYGYDNHYFSVIEYCSIEELNERERFWQDEYEAINDYGLNCKLTSDSDKTGKVSLETRKKMSDKRKGHNYCEGRIYSPETIEKMRLSAKTRIQTKRKPMSDEARANLSLLRKGKKGHPQTEETRKKITDSNLQRWAKIKLQNEQLN